jgi:hypothetical protein
MSYGSGDMARSMARAIRTASARMVVASKIRLILEALRGQHSSRGVIDGSCNPATLTG